MQIHRLTVLVVGTGLALAGCHQKAPAPAKVKPATVEHIEGSEVSRVTLTERAAQRLRIQTAAVQSVTTRRSGGERRIVVPYASILYDAKGHTWLYASPESLRYVRHPIEVDYIEGELAVLSSGPPAGTTVVTVGALQLFGAEFEIGH